VKFQQSALAHKWLDGLKGIEIGGSAHNAFGLDTINVDYTDDMTTVFKLEEVKLCGEAMSVDVVARGDKLPFPDKSFDFVLSSHVIEHIFDPIGALREWSRVARKYVYTVVPHPDRTFDKGRPITTLDELRARPHMPEPLENAHFNVWRLEDFIPACWEADLLVVDVCDPDDKVGNGFAVVCQVP
jgi:SAM-dependent methyltransferase